MTCPNVNFTDAEGWLVDQMLESSEPLRCEVMVTEAWGTTGQYAQACNMSGAELRQGDDVPMCESCRKAQGVR